MDVGAEAYRHVYREMVLMRFVGIGVATAAVFCAHSPGIAEALPSSVHRDGGPSYEHELGKDSADGQLYCSGLTASRTSKALTRAPSVQLGTPCAKLGDRAHRLQTDSVATCRHTPQGRRWQ